MYRLVNVNDKKVRVIARSDNLTTLWEMLDSPELKYKTPVIIDESGEVRAGHWTAYQWAKLRDFNLTNKVEV